MSPLRTFQTHQCLSLKMHILEDTWARGFVSFEWFRLAAMICRPQYNIMDEFVLITNSTFIVQHDCTIKPALSVYYDGNPDCFVVQFTLAQCNLNSSDPGAWSEHILFSFNLQRRRRRPYLASELSAVPCHTAWSSVNVRWHGGSAWPVPCMPHTYHLSIVHFTTNAIYMIPDDCIIIYIFAKHVTVVNKKWRSRPLGPPFLL